jgi:hypothetical protein
MQFFKILNVKFKKISFNIFLIIKGVFKEILLRLEINKNKIYDFSINNRNVSMINTIYRIKDSISD